MTPIPSRPPTPEEALLLNSALSSGRISIESVGPWALRLQQQPRFFVEILADLPPNASIAEHNWLKSRTLRDLSDQWLAHCGLSAPDPAALRFADDEGEDLWVQLADRMRLS